MVRTPLQWSDRDGSHAHHTYNAYYKGFDDNTMENVYTTSHNEQVRIAENMHIRTKS